jgi:hypothetical protein
VLQYVEAHGVRLPVLDAKPEYALAHPEEAHIGGHCDKCVLALNPLTGDIILLWCCGGINWSISRENERAREELLDEIERLAA